MGRSLWSLWLDIEDRYRGWRFRRRHRRTVELVTNPRPYDGMAEAICRHQHGPMRVGEPTACDECRGVSAVVREWLDGQLSPHVTTLDDRSLNLVRAHLGLEESGA